MPVRLSFSTVADQPQDQADQSPDQGEQPALLPIVQVGEPVLRSRGADVREDELEALAAHIPVMVATMRAAPGVGLAAPQVGDSRRYAVVEDRSSYIDAMPDGEADRLERRALELGTIINPRYEPVGERMVMHFEGCLSLDGYRALVARHHTVRVNWTDLTGNSHEEILSGWQARIFQHEIDHLDGILYIDRMEPRSFMSNRNWARHWMEQSEDEVCQALGISS